MGAHLQDSLQPGYQGLNQLSSLEWFPTKTGYSSKIVAVVCFFPLERSNFLDKSTFLKVTSDCQTAQSCLHLLIKDKKTTAGTGRVSHQEPSAAEHHIGTTGSCSRTLGCSGLPAGIQEARQKSLARAQMGGLPKLSLQKGGESGCCCLMAVRCCKVTRLDGKGQTEQCKEQFVPARFSPLKKKSSHPHRSMSNFRAKSLVLHPAPHWIQTSTATPT